MKENSWTPLDYNHLSNVFCLKNVMHCDALSKANDLMRHLNANRSKSNIKPTKINTNRFQKSFNFYTGG